MRALSIRQPYAELILRGVKTVEFRSRPTRIVGERFYVYAAGKWAVGGGRSAGKTKAWSRDLSTALPPPPGWMVELADALILDALPTGVIVGSAVVERVTPFRPDDGHGYDGLYRWHLAGVERLATPRKPTRHPQPAWFRPF